MITDKNASELIKQYGFCTVETQLALQNAGFFDKVKPRMCLYYQKPNINVSFAGYFFNDFFGEKVLNSDVLLAMPQFDEVWAQLPHRIPTTVEAFKIASDFTIGYETSKVCAIYNGECIYMKVIDKNITDAACRLWLKLKELGLLKN